MPEVVNTSALVIDQGETEGAEDSRPVMIDVDHVSMSFNMASEQLNSLKEYALALAKGKLFFEEFKALDDVSFQVRKGDVFGIMGTNGSGKSTILKIIAGVLEPTKGKCTVNGNIAPLIELGAGFDMDLSARENIYLNGALLGYSRDFINEHFDEIVEFAEVEKFLDMPLKNYSSGMVSRIAFAIATVIVPEILVVDEVLSVGDFMFQRKCENRITQLIEEYGVTVLIVSHSNDQIARLCNKAIWIEKGHERLQGDAKMVAHVYGGLGGRTGSKESERIVFEALLREESKHVELFSETVAGESFAGTDAKLVASAWGDELSDCVCLASDVTHASAIVGTSFASACNAPLLSVGSGDRLPDSVSQHLSLIKPRKIFLFDCGWQSSSLMRALEGFSWNPEVIGFGEGLDLFGFSRQVYEYGFNQFGWNDSVALIGFDDNLEAFSIAPYLSFKRTPVFVLKPADMKGSAIREFLRCLPASKVELFGTSAIDGFADACFSSDKEIVGVRTREDICRFVDDAFAGVARCVPRKLYVASGNIGQWPELVSCGSCCGRELAPLLLMEQANLDSVAYSLDYVFSRRNSIEKIVFIGDALGLNSLEKSLLVSQLEG